jgi:hypothetical protein
VRARPTAIVRLVRALAHGVTPTLAARGDPGRGSPWKWSEADPGCTRGQGAQPRGAPVGRGCRQRVTTVRPSRGPVKRFDFLIHSPIRTTPPTERSG